MRSAALLLLVGCSAHLGGGGGMAGGDDDDLRPDAAVSFPDDYKQLVTAWGYWCAGAAANIVVYGLASGERMRLDHSSERRLIWI